MATCTCSMLSRRLRWIAVWGVTGTRHAMALDLQQLKAKHGDRRHGSDTETESSLDSTEAPSKNGGLPDDQKFDLDIAGPRCRSLFCAMGDEGTRPLACFS